MTILPDRLEAIARVLVAKGGVVVQGRQQINFIEQGGGVAFTIADNAVNERVDVTVEATMDAEMLMLGGM